MVTFKNVFTEHVFGFFLFVSRVPITLYSLTLKTGLDDIVCVLFRPKKRKRKKKIGIIIRILMWSSSCLLVFWARLVKTCNKKGEAEMHWTVGQLIGLVWHPLVSDCIPLYHRRILNYYKSLKLYLISNHKLGMAPLLPVGFTETCPVYLLLTVTLWSMNLHYKFLV